ncbi:MAG: 2-amino-4-hydroxy-6-hydroxymethyldihydropteridine diphosphokinase [Selenomonas sp.]|uniref:2-amino-4-hydroxy-6- hydroxymethyldihydropteridine diphosphokinase n=1 Tax=Selenomonas sp. TaxID=2053611 RepID=UPI0025E53744|nr:2-amino-4-hydroxy-6-hydroxymethyldihydropteridine diphosphokinase [Selenomonas sp.]MCR5758286.1 2-amino-4-hydroxy-6-hydroxymethyldihydropteridine diphosphokinase [Selenomonas sp.]
MKIYLSLGANLGNRGETLRAALRCIACLPDTKLIAVAPFYETAPWGNTDQPAFINTAAAVDTELPPLFFLQKTQRIEKDLGRVRHEHWGARTIDIDLLCAEGFSSDIEVLKMPHPFLTKRAFVLRPLQDIAPNLVVHGRTVTEWCQDEELARQEISLVAEVNEPYPLFMIAAVDEKMGIGWQGNLLVRNKEDMDHFKRETFDQIVIMGRKTLDSLPGGKPLPHRINIVLSQTSQREDVLVCRNLSELWCLLGQLYRQNPRRKFICIGGGEMYALLMPYARELQLTQFKGTFAADTFFPAVDEFCEIDRKSRQGFSFIRYVRQVSVAAERSRY